MKKLIYLFQLNKYFVNNIKMSYSEYINNNKQPLIDIINAFNLKQNTNFIPTFNRGNYLEVAQKTRGGKKLSIYVDSLKFEMVDEPVFYIKYNEKDYSVQINGVYSLEQCLYESYDILYNTNSDPTITRN